MKLCFIGSDSPHVLRWIKYFVDKGHEVSLITFSDVTKLPFKGVRIINLEPYDFLNPKNIIRVYQLIKKVKKILKEIKPDIIHVHQISSLAYIVPFLKFHPYVLSAWGTDILLRPNMKKSYSLLASNTIKKADMLHVPGMTTINALLELGADKNKIIQIYFGTNCNTFNPNNYNTKVKNKLGPKNSTVIISHRGLRPIYNIETLIRSVPFVINENSNVSFVIVGEGETKNKLINLAKTLQISEYIIFTGYITLEDLLSYLASSDIYVSTSLSDGGLTACTREAMATELPVIITENPDNREWIEEGVNGFVIPVKSPDVLAKRIIKLIKNKELRKEMGRRNRKLIVEKNNYFIEMSKMEEEYYKLIKN